MLDVMSQLPIFCKKLMIHYLGQSCSVSYLHHVCHGDGNSNATQMQQRFSFPLNCMYALRNWDGFVLTKYSTVAINK